MNDAGSQLGGALVNKAGADLQIPDDLVFVGNTVVRKLLVRRFAVVSNSENVRCTRERTEILTVCSTITATELHEASISVYHDGIASVPFSRPDEDE